MTKNIGPSFSDELKSAGLLDLPFVWYPDGSMNIDQLTEEQKTAVMGVYDAHDPLLDPGTDPSTAQSWRRA